MSDVVNRNSKINQGAQQGAESAQGGSSSPIGAAVSTAGTAMGAYGTVMGFTNNVAEAAVMPVLSKLSFMQGIACLPASSHLDPVLGIDVHFVIIPPSPAPIPMPHPFIAIVMDPKDWISCAVMSVAAMAAPVATGDADKDAAAGLAFGVATMALALLGLGATVKLGNFTPRTTSGVSNLVIPHFPMGASFYPVPVLKNSGHAQFGSLFLSADTNPFSGLLHLNNDCWDIGIMQLMRRAYPSEPMHLYLPTGFIMAIPSHNVIVNPIPTPINPIAGLTRIFNLGLGKLLNRMAGRLPAGSRISNALSKAICHVTGHPVDVSSGMLFTDEDDFYMKGPVMLSWERTWYSDSTYEGPLGHGWHHNYDMGFFIDEYGQGILRMNDGRLAAFELPQPGKSTYNRMEKFTLHCQGEEKVYYVTDREGLIYRFTNKKFGKEHFLQSVSNANGHAIRFEYDRKGWLVQIIDSAGRSLQVDNDRLGRIVAITAPDATVEGKTFVISRYSYDEDGNMVSQTDSLGQSMHYEYKGYLLVKETWRDGQTWFFEYDGVLPGARCVHTWGDGGLYDHRLSYLDGRTLVENSLGYITAYRLHDGLVSGITDANGAYWEYRYNRYHELEWKTDPMGNQEGYTHDDWGNIATTTDPDGGFTYTEYYHPGYPHLPTEVLDAAGGKWSWSYDERGNMLEKCNPLGACTRYEYRDGLLAVIINPDGAILSLHYDQQHNLVRLEGDGGAVTSYSYDRLGNSLTIINPNGKAQRRLFDSKSRVRELQDFDGNTIDIEYDGLDNVIHYQDKYKDIRYTYRGLWKLTSSTEAGATIYFNYDTEEQLRKVVNQQGQAYTFLLDPVGKVTVETGFDGITRGYERNEAGWVTRVNRPGGRYTRYEYDVCGRVTDTHYSDGSKDHYTYRSNGDLMTATNDWGTIRLEKDVLGNVTKESTDKGWVGASYDHLGRRTKTKSSYGAAITQVYNTVGEVLELTVNGWQARMEYDHLGLETSRSLPGGVVSRWQRDGIGRPVAHTVGHKSKRYTWDVDDRLRQIKDDRGITSYEHDVWSNLAKTVFPDGEVQLRNPDAGGNLFRASDRKDRVYSRGGRLKKAGGWEYEYDGEGNMTVKKHANGQRWSYEWNDAGELIKVTRPDNTEVSFGYDALGRRVWKKYKNTITTFVWDGDVLLHEWKEHAVTGALLGSSTVGEGGIATEGGITTWLFDTDSFAPAAKIKGDRRYSIVSDHLGTPAQLYKEDGVLFWEGELDSYGKLRMEKGETGSCPFRYQGQYEDSETGLYYNRFRYYSPEEGIYLSRDPLRIWGGTRLYGYVHDPNSWLDPFGLSAYSQRRREREKGKHTRNSEYPHGNRKKVRERVIKANTNARGQIIDPATGDVIPASQVTIEHKMPVVQHWNTQGYNQTKQQRKDWYNDENNLTVKPKATNSGEGAKMPDQYRQDTGLNYEK